MSDYTPTTEEVRGAYQAGGRGLDSKRVFYERGEAFDRWLQARDAEKDAEIARLRLVHAGQARLAMMAVFMSDVDGSDDVQAFYAEWKRHHDAQVLRDAAERWSEGGASGLLTGTNSIRMHGHSPDDWLRAEADKITNHNEQEQSNAE